MQLSEIETFLGEFAPLELAEDWDNIGLLLGDPEAAVQRVMTCLTLTPDVAEEAMQHQAQLVVSHHPVMFRPLQKLTTRTPEGKMLLDLARAGIGVYSPHTAFDSCQLGINQQLAEAFGLSDIRPLRVSPESELGSGRIGTLTTPQSLSQLMETIQPQLGAAGLQFVGEETKRIQSVAVACGAAGEFLRDAVGQGADLFVTGETRFHTCLEARTAGIQLLLLGHYPSERFAVVELAKQLTDRFPELHVWASAHEKDPLKWR